MWRTLPATLEIPWATLWSHPWIYLHLLCTWLFSSDAWLWGLLPAALAYLCAASLQGSLRPLADCDRIGKAQFPCFKFWRMVRCKLPFRVPHRTGPRLDFAWNHTTNLFPCPAQLSLFLPIYLGSTILMNHLGPEPLYRALLLGSLTKDTWWFSWGGSWTDFNNRLWILMSHFLSHAAKILLGRDMASTETCNCKIWINVSVLKVVSADDTEG